MSEITRVWIVGGGAVGSVLAALLTRAVAGRGPADGRWAAVTLIGTREHWRAVREDGLAFDSGLPPGTRVPLATADPEAAPIFGREDLVVLAGKLPQLAEAAGWLRGRLRAEAHLLSLQNGLGIDERVTALLGHATERGLVYFGAHVPAPGRVRYFPGRIRFRAGPAAARLSELLGDEVACEIAPDFRAAEWEKLAVNCLANPLAAILGTRNDALGDARLDPVKEAILAEVRAAAQSEGVRLTLTVAHFNAYITGATGGNIPSLAIDLARGRTTEIDFLNGAVVRIGRERGLAVGVNASISAMIEFLTRRAQRQAPTGP
ncbi:MAG: ketopantoate reductase family protein [Candidatus Eisenbacteria bacterium]